MSDELSTIIDFGEDITDAEAPPPLPAGRYTATIREAKPKVSANSGNKYADIAMHIAPDQFPVDFPAENNPDGVTLYFRRLLLEPTPSARFRMRKFCEAIGAPTAKQLDLNDWVGLTCEVEVSNSQYEGLPRAEINRVVENA